MKKILTLFICLICASSMKADEGMWMLNKLSEATLKQMKALGLELSAKDLYNPYGTSLKDAVVSFMTLKMKVEFEDGADVDAVMKNVYANCKKVEEDCEIYL